MKCTFGVIALILTMSMLATAAPEEPIFRMRRRGVNSFDNSAAKANNAAFGPVTDPQPVAETVAGTPQTPGAPQTPGVPA
ncbi:hypothetical protein CPB97_011701 [Podila verticillata]|nr:hypothetical protein CPB97_011701 [Podila verticillata]